MKKMKKGQAAMEYLMTYGWAILIVLAIMAILIYMVRPQQMETCNVAVPLQCEPEHYTVDTSGNLTIRIKNMGTVSYSIISSKCGTNVYNYNPPLFLSPAGYVDVYFNCTGKVESNAVPGKDVFKEAVSITYYPTDAQTFTKTQQIEVVVKYKS